MRKVLQRAILILLVGISFLTNAQPFANEIAAFKKQDSVSVPPKNAILFIGSSSFRLWQDVNNYFPGYTIINRGFGGSTLLDVIHYAKDVVQPYHPRQIVIYCGENDLASSDTVTADIVMKRFEILFYLIREYYPKVPIAFVSIKPSPSRQRLMPEMVKANALISDFLKKKSKTSFINVYNPMLLPDGNPMPDIFREDNLHMNAKGYAIWQKIMLPYLIKAKTKNKNQ